MNDAVPTSASPTASMLVVVNARVRTGDPRRPVADAVLVRDGDVVAVGSSAELRKRAGSSAEVIDARGWAVTSRHGAGLLVPGGAADLLVVAGEPDASSPIAPHDPAVAIVIERGRVVRDRDAAAGAASR
jgi:imidazolonepropionase-like amidohydrolase